MENEGVDFLTTLAEEDYDWAVDNSYELHQIGYDLPPPDDDDYYWSMRQAESFEAECWDCGTTLDECVGCKRDRRRKADYMYCPECEDEGFDSDLGWFCCGECWDENTVTSTVLRAESFEAPYTGAGSLMGISGDTDLSSFTPDELTKSSAIHGDFDTASLDYSGHQNLEVRAEDEPDCDHGTTDMSGRCLHCTMTEADRMNEREGGGWEDCPTCGVAIKVGSNSCRNCSEQRVWTILIDDNDAYSETFVFNSKKSAINFREAAMDSEYLAQQDIGVYNIVEQLVIDEEYPSDPYIADRLSIDCLKCGDEC